MLINEGVIEELCNDAGQLRREKAIKYKNQGKVIIKKSIYDNKNNLELYGEVYGTEVYQTYIDIKNGEIQLIECDCPDYHNTYGVCKHTLATVLKFNEGGFESVNEQLKTQNKVSQKNKYNSFNQIVKTLYNEELDEIDSNLDIELKNKANIKIEQERGCDF